MRAEQHENGRETLHPGKRTMARRRRKKLSRNYRNVLLWPVACTERAGRRRRGRFRETREKRTNAVVRRALRTATGVVFSRKRSTNKKRQWASGMRRAVIAAAIVVVINVGDAPPRPR